MGGHWGEALRLFADSPGVTGAVMTHRIGPTWSWPDGEPGPEDTLKIPASFPASFPEDMTRCRSRLGIEG